MMKRQIRFFVDCFVDVKIKIYFVKIIGEKDADGFYWGECGGLSGYVPCNMISEVQVDDERLARELLKVLYVPLLCTLSTLFVLYVRPVLYVPI